MLQLKSWNGSPVEVDYDGNIVCPACGSLDIEVHIQAEFKLRARVKKDLLGRYLLSWNYLEDDPTKEEVLWMYCTREGCDWDTDEVSLEAFPPANS